MAPAARLWTYTSDHIAAFVKDIERQGRGDDVAWWFLANSDAVSRRTQAVVQIMGRPARSSLSASRLKVDTMARHQA